MWDYPYRQGWYVIVPKIIIVNITNELRLTSICRTSHSKVMSIIKKMLTVQPNSDSGSYEYNWKIIGSAASLKKNSFALPANSKGLVMVMMTMLELLLKIFQVRGVQKQDLLPVRPTATPGLGLVRKMKNNKNCVLQTMVRFAIILRDTFSFRPTFSQ